MGRRVAFQMTFTAAALAVTACMGAQEFGPSQPIETDVADYFEELFDSIGATVASANVVGSSCQEVIMDFGNTKGPNGWAVSSLHMCKTDLGCGEFYDIPIWRDNNGTLWFGPDNVETIVAVGCPEAIPDPAKRAEIVQQVENQMGVELQ